MSSAMWILIGEGKLDIKRARGRYHARVRHQRQRHDYGRAVAAPRRAAFRSRRIAQNDWLDRDKRREKFKTWRLEFPVGSVSSIIATSTFWVLADIIERRSGQDFRHFVRDRIAAPLGLPELRLGVPPGEHHRVADLAYVGDALTPEDYKKMGLPEPPVTEVTETMILGFNDPIVRESGVPGGGGIMTAGELALFYQGLLHNRRPQWQADLAAGSVERSATAALGRLLRSNLQVQV